MIVDWSAVFATLPRPAYRRSYFAGPSPLQDEQGEDPTFWYALLCRVAPGRARGLRNGSAFNVYQSLLEECASRFPCVEFVFDEAEMLGFIPVDALGVDPWEATVRSPAIALCIVAHRTPKDPWMTTPASVEEEGEAHAGTVADCFRVEDFHCLTRYRSLIPPDLGATRVNELHPRCPSGRTWREPWHALNDLFAYANNNTGFGLLDITDTELSEGAYSAPEWNVDEIQSLTVQWRDAQPVYGRAMALSQHIDADPRRRLPQLARVLLGDREVLREITEPKRVRTRVQVFA